ncbi:MAG: S41 family peptidase [Balneolaceae bacterium]
MSNKYFLFLFIGIGVLLISCEQVILGSDEPNNPEHNFEILWNDFDKHYALFEVKNINWDSLYTVYRPQVTPSTSDDELWQLITEMLDHLDDEHVKIRIQAEEPHNYVEFASGAEKNLRALEEFSIELIAGAYVETLYQKDDFYSYGKLYNENIGYIHAIAMLGANPSSIYNAISELGDLDAIIMDVRNNIGGADQYSAEFARTFSDGRHFLYTVETRNGPNYDDFDAPLKVFSKPHQPNNFTKPVVLLTDTFTISAAEIFTMHMKSFSHVTHIGDTTAGAHSDVGAARFLPNGWTYEYSIMKYLMPDGTSLEGVGIAPDIYKQNSSANIEAERDIVLEYAIEFLNTKKIN